MFEQDQKGTFRCQTCFGCDGLLKGWTDARQSQKKGEKWEKRKMKFKHRINNIVERLLRRGTDVQTTNKEIHVIN